MKFAGGCSAWLAVIASIAVPGGAAAQAAWDFLDAGLIATGFQYAVVDREGDIAAALSPAGRITVLDMSQEPASMVVEHLAVSSPKDLDIANGLILVGADNGGPSVTVVDSSKLAAGADKVAVPGSGSLGAVRWVGTEHFVVVRGQDLHYFDVEPGQSPIYGGIATPFAKPETPSPSTRYLSAGTTLYIDRAPFVFMDFSNPAGNQPIGAMPQFEGSTYYMDAEYAISLTVETCRIVDISHPPYCHVVGDFPTVADSFVAADRDDWRLVTVGRQWAIMRDVSDPSQCAVIGMRQKVDVFGEVPHDVAVRGNNVIISGEVSGLRALVFTGPQQPQFSGDKWSVK